MRRPKRTSPSRQVPGHPPREECGAPSTHPSDTLRALDFGAQTAMLSFSNHLKLRVRSEDPASFPRKICRGRPGRRPASAWDEREHAARGRRPARQGDQPQTGVPVASTQSGKGLGSVRVAWCPRPAPTNVWAKDTPEAAPLSRKT